MTVNPGSLLPHQDTGSDVLADFGGTHILADEMGVGKTRTAIATAVKLSAFPCVVVCPVQVKYTWRAEILGEDGKLGVCPDARVEIIGGRKGDIPSGAGFYVINRDILADRLDELVPLRPRLLVIDEAHRIGGYGTKMLKAFWHLAEAVRKNGGGVMPVTGTPITNDYTDLHRLFAVMAPGVFGSRTHFEEEYCPDVVFKNKIFGGIFAGKPRWMVMRDFRKAQKEGLVPHISSEKLEELTKIVRKWSIRRYRKDVWRTIPHTVNVWKIEIEDEEVKECDAVARRRMAAGGDSNDGEFSYIRRLVAEAKIPFVLDWIRNFLEQTDEKLVVFVWHVEVRKAIVKEFGSLAVSVGGTSADKRKAEMAFQNDASVRVCVCNAGIEGVTLTAARTALFAELPWTHAAFGQAKDRINRIGQEAEDLDYTVCIAADTVEEIVWKIVNRKRDLTAKVMG